MTAASLGRSFGKARRVPESSDPDESSVAVITTPHIII